MASSNVTWTKSSLGYIYRTSRLASIGFLLAASINYLGSRGHS